MSFTNDGWFVIKDFNSFVEQTRILVFNTYGKIETENSDTDSLLTLSSKDQQELNTLLSLDESVSIIKSLVKKQKNKKTNQIRFIINNDLYLTMIQHLGDRITSNVLQQLVKKGVVETGYDSESNDFIFWIKE